MKTELRVARSVSLTRSPVILRADLHKLGCSSTSLSAALRALIDKGLLVRIGTGIYAKAKPSVLSGKPIPVEPLEVLAPIALRKLGVMVQQARRYRDYNAGRTSQVPVGVVVNVGSRRITRRIGFNGKVVEYEHT
ncbi:MAG: S-adenosylhomocysteine hydrolase [Hydrogenophaga sp.]|uniref:type IV toxin-antitoxin system AbiEi family antitoxin domain-containing protein n=1 Tax=Hydrogenophaga sp. TaxID=1904254 RepID=UPI002579A2FC|nr:type IV toxin-antitoxin system AbiEi family antitoxin domain-containing protein [Hydrogenophaga sp.]MBL0944550.1 S-adenosylhomocysteine hydrolase [Hydrogenophaga sp.]